ncbi:hypothetical protein PIB30_068637, partial [Stylosanthes scabra]|nr:hypothetical protein [Stylosanthes scabra]
DLDGVLNNWGKVEPNMGPVGNDQGPYQKQTKHRTTAQLHRGSCNFQVWGGRYFAMAQHRNKKAPKDLLMITQVYATILIGELKGKSRKAGIGWEPRAFLTRYTRVNERKHDQAKFGAEVAKESMRNEKIAKKSLKAKSRAYAYAPKEPMRTHCHALGVTS